MGELPARLGRTDRWLARLGARKLGGWVRRTPDTTNELAKRAGQLYTALACRAAWPRNLVLRWQLAGYVLPGAALYRGLLEHGWSSETAADAVGTALERDTQRRRRRMERRGRRRGFFTALAVIIRLLTGLVYPRPGWQVRWLEVSRNRVAFDMTCCYYLTELSALGVGELTPVYCRVDDILYEGVSPYLAWRRTALLATGGDRCDFRFERQPAVSH